MSIWTGAYLSRSAWYFPSEPSGLYTSTKSYVRLNGPPHVDVFRTQLEPSVESGACTISKRTSELRGEKYESRAVGLRLGRLGQQQRRARRPLGRTREATGPSSGAHPGMVHHEGTQQHGGTQQQQLDWMRISARWKSAENSKR